MNTKKFLQFSLDFIVLVLVAFATEIVLAQPGTGGGGVNSFPRNSNWIANAYLKADGDGGVIVDVDIKTKDDEAILQVNGDEWPGFVAMWQGAKVTPYIGVAKKTGHHPFLVDSWDNALITLTGLQNTNMGTPSVVPLDLVWLVQGSYTDIWVDRSLVRPLADVTVHEVKVRLGGNHTQNKALFGQLWIQRGKNGDWEKFSRKPYYFHASTVSVDTNYMICKKSWLFQDARGKYYNAKIFMYEPGKSSKLPNTYVKTRDVKFYVDE